MEEILPRGSELALRLARLGDEFLVEILGRETQRRPENLEALAERAHALTRLGRHAEGLKLDMALVDARPEDPVVRYNLACSLALMGRAHAALSALEHAVACGFDDAEHLLGDEDLASLREEPRFRKLVAQLE